MNLFPLFDPLVRQMEGIATYPSKRALSPGWWSSAINIRADDMTMRVRDGYRVIYNPGSGFVSRGAVSAYGKVYIALDDGTKTELYEVDTDNGVAENPDPSLSFQSGKTIGITPVKQYLRSGISVPLLAVTSAAEDMCLIRPLDVSYPIITRDKMWRMWRWPRLDGSAITVVADTPNYINLRGGSATITGVARLNGSHSAGDPISISANNPVKGDAVTVDFGATAAMYSLFGGANVGLLLTGDEVLYFTSETLILVVDDPSASFLRQVKVEISRDGTNWTAIWDPSPTSGLPLTDETYKDSAEITGRVWGFDLTKIPASTRSFRYMRFTWGSDIASYSETVKIHAILGGGRVDGESTWAISLAGTTTLFEGQVAVQATQVDTPILSERGGSKAWGDRKVPNLASLKYAYRVSIINPSLLNASEPQRAIYALCYRIPAGDDRAHYQSGELLYSAPFGWLHGSGPNQRVTFTINRKTSEDWAVPPAYGTGIANDDYLSHIAIYSGSRLVAANKDRTAIYVSEHSRPTRMSGIVDFVEDQPVPWSATYVIFGDDKIVSLAKVSNTMIGSDVLVVLTDKAMYTIETSSSQNASTPRLAQRHGCLATYGVATFADSIAYVDSERQIRIINQYGETTPSRLTVEDQLINCPDISKVVAGYFKDAFYFFYSVPGETENRHALVWDLRLSRWFMYRYPTGFDVVRLLNHNDPDGNPMFLAVLSDGKVVQLEYGTSDNGADIEIDLQTPDFHGAPWEIMSAGRLGILIDGVGRTLTTNREVVSGTSSISSGKIVVPMSSEPQWLMDEPDGHTSLPGGAGASVRFSITGSVPGGTRIYGIFAEIEQTQRVGANG
jgi:hypothetical protein